MGDPLDLSFDLRQHINLRDKTLLSYMRQIVDRQAEGTLKAIGAANKISEKVGETQALDFIRRRFPGSQPVIVVARPNGVPVLDLVLATPGGQVVVVEAKFSSAGVAKLGNNRLMWVYVEGEGFDGWMATRVAKGEIVQMSPRWMVNRISELDREGQRHLAVRLARALRAGNVRAVTIVTDSTGEVLERACLSHTEEWIRAFSGENPSIRLPEFAGEAEAPATIDRRTRNRTGPAVPEEGGRMAPRGSVEPRAPRPTAEGHPSTIGSRGVEGRLGSVAARDGGEAAIREGAEVLTRRAIVARTLRLVGRALVTVISRALLILDVVGFAFMVVEIVELLVAHWRDKSIEKALDEALRTHLPGQIKSALEKDKDEIARYFARAWNRKTPSAPAVFIWLTPRLIVEGGHGRDGFEFKVRLRESSFEKSLISTRFVAPERQEIVDLTPSYYSVQTQWSMPQPIFTPFDVYLALVRFAVEQVVDSWTMLYVDGRRLDAATVESFRSTVEVLAEISASLKFEPWFDYPSAREGQQSRVALARWRALQGLSSMVLDRLIPKVQILEAKKLLNAASIRWETYADPAAGELAPRGEPSLVPTLKKMALDMKYLDGADLEYERFETLQSRQRELRGQPAHTGVPIDQQKILDLKEYLQPVQHRLPKASIPDLKTLELNIDDDQAARLFIPPFE